MNPVKQAFEDWKATAAGAFTSKWRYPLSAFLALFLFMLPFMFGADIYGSFQKGEYGSILGMFFVALGGTAFGAFARDNDIRRELIASLVLIPTVMVASYFLFAAFSYFKGEFGGWFTLPFALLGAASLIPLVLKETRSWGEGFLERKEKVREQ